MEKVKGYLAALISSVSFGLIPWFIIPVKEAHFSMDTTLAYRFSLAALMALIILLVKGEGLKLTKREGILLFSLGMYYAVSNELLFLGYDLTSPAIASTLLFIYPLFVAIISLFFFKEKIKNLTYLALIISLSGVYILTMGSSAFSINIPGLMVSLGAAVLYALYIITVNEGKMKLSAWKISFYSLFFAALYYLIKSGIRGETLVLPSWHLFGNFALFALVTTVISNVGLIYAAQRIGSTPTAIMGVLEPVVAALVSVFIFFEPATWKLWVGMALIISAVVFNILAERKRSG